MCMMCVYYIIMLWIDHIIMLIPRQILYIYIANCTIFMRQIAHIYSVQYYIIQLINVQMMDFYLLYIRKTLFNMSHSTVFLFKKKKKDSDQNTLISVLVFWEEKEHFDCRIDA